MKKILLTGGGTAGHVSPNIALLPQLRAEGYHIVYIGRHDGIEKELITNCKIPYFAISSGKFRRYFDLKNVRDAFKAIKGLADAYKIIEKEKPNVIFSKGGFVAVPVVIAGWLCRIPVVIHESDMTPGLANKLSIPFSKAVCVSFPETLAHIDHKKTFLTGSPIRRELFEGDKKKGLHIAGFSRDKPVVLVMGGSSGSVKINTCFRQALNRLLKIYQVIHICGNGNVDEALERPGYKQFPYVGRELPHVLAAADIIVSRAGANSIAEFLALKKPSLLIPLSKKASRGDQILNAESFQAQGFCKVLDEERMNEESLTTAIIDLYNSREIIIKKMSQSVTADGVREVMNVIRQQLDNR